MIIIVFVINVASKADKNFKNYISNERQTSQRDINHYSADASSTHIVQHYSQ